MKALLLKAVEALKDLRQWMLDTETDAIGRRIVLMSPRMAKADAAIADLEAAIREQPGEAVAWMTDEDPPRVASAYTKASMPRPSKENFCIPLYAVAPLKDEGEAR